MLNHEGHYEVKYYRKLNLATDVLQTALVADKNKWHKQKRLKNK